MGAMDELTVFMCGPKKYHTCDSNGAEIIGGDDFQMKREDATQEQLKRCTWGSVSCSVCGTTAMENDVWRDL